MKVAMRFRGGVSFGRGHDPMLSDEGGHQQPNNNAVDKECRKNKGVCLDAHFRDRQGKLSIRGNWVDSKEIKASFKLKKYKKETH